MTGKAVSKIGREMSLRSRKLSTPKLLATLLGSTVLAGLPTAALAQADDELPPAVVNSAPISAPAPAPQPAPQPTVYIIRSIVVAGAERLEPATILSYIQMRPGNPYSESAADEALKDLYATELFANVEVRHQTGDVTIEVQENPVVNRIILEGNKRIKNDKIYPEINLAPRQIFTRSKVRADVARIIELYKRQGRFAAVVEPKSVQLPQNRVDIVYEISEGPKSKVRQINIIGNEVFSDGDLRSEMITKQARLTRLFSSSTSYDPDRLAFDQQKLRQFYLTEGYADFRVISAVAELTPDKRDFIITYVVEEGERYHFGTVEVESQLRDFDGDVLAQRLAVREGDWYNAKLVEDTIEGLTEAAGTFGYAFADVSPRYTRDAETKTMSIRFVINEAPRVYVEAINVNGNTLTQDKVVRREFRLAEGDAFNSLAVRRSTNRINSLGYFQENFEIDQVQGSAPDRIVLNADVQEQPTGELQLSAGFSSLESFILSGSIRQRNFRGRGQTIGASVNWSRYSRSATLSFVEPYVRDRNYSFGVDIYRRDLNNWYPGQSGQRFSTFKQGTTGFSARLGVPLTEYISLITRYTLNFDDISIDPGSFFTDNDNDGVRGENPDDTCDAFRAGRYLCDAIGKRTSSIIGVSAVYNSLDSNVRPTSGTSMFLNLDYSGLGGSVKYARLRANIAKFHSFGGGWIFSLRGEGGYIMGLGASRGPGEDKVRLTDRFFLGDPQMRGFDIRGVGPRVLREAYAFDVVPDTPPDTPAMRLPLCGDGMLLADCTANGGYTFISDPSRTYDDPLGGRIYYLGRAELEIPLGTGARELGLRPSIFVDAGAVFNITQPVLIDTGATYCVGQCDADGNPLWLNNGGTPTDPSDDIFNTTGGEGFQLVGQKLEGFREIFTGDSAKPRIAIGAGVNWNSPFGPFRIDFAHVLSKVPGDDTKAFTFNVGTQF
jgi:outer membrane protein insertion porin family